MRKIVRCWTEEELKILKDNYLTLTQRELAKLLGRTQRAVGHKLCLLGWFVSEEEHSRRTGEALRATILSRNITGENNPHWKGGVSKDSSRYNKRYKERYPEKFKANSLVRAAVRNGSLVRQPCIICGKPNAEAHHEDYSKPFAIIWFCKKHHYEYHKNLQDSKKAKN